MYMKKVSSNFSWFLSSLYKILNRYQFLRLLYILYIVNILYIIYILYMLYT